MFTLDKENTLFYDIEVFRHNSMVVFKNWEGETVDVFSPTTKGLEGKVTGNLHDGYEELGDYLQGKTLVGYNNYFYDDRILNLMYRFCKRDNLNDILKEGNDNLIRGADTSTLPPIRICTTLDTFTQIDVSKPSLKKIEGNMGVNIEETKIPFDIDRPLTDEENYLTYKYCEYDVLMTSEIFKMRKNYFTSKFALIDMLDWEEIKPNALKWNTTGIIGNLLRPKRKALSINHVPKWLIQQMPSEVQDMINQLNTVAPAKKIKLKTNKVTVEAFGCKIEFGLGGLHGVPIDNNGMGRWENVRLYDVTSLYPNIIINLNGLGDKSTKYRRILETSTRLKHDGKKEERAPYKLILNSTSGLLESQYSHLNNPHFAQSMRFYGQCILYLLCGKLYNAGATLININTDGVAFVGGDDEQVQKVIREWEDEFNFVLEEDDFDLFIQKDVNNYIAKIGDALKLKGGDVNKYRDNQFFKNNDIRIVQMCLVDYLLYGKEPWKTIEENVNNPLLFQYVLKAGNTYQGVVSIDDNGTETELDTKVNRVFAANEKAKHVRIEKKRKDGGRVRFADTPERMFVWNKDVKELGDFKDIVDIQFYYDLAVKKIKQWIPPMNKSKGVLRA